MVELGCHDVQSERQIISRNHRLRAMMRSLFPCGIMENFL
ncbi:hypothetical protein CAter10_4047 [Collimonas arenae]|nr:hypothetical protein CAter10_4047 [Collimonas arenae]